VASSQPGILAVAGPSAFCIELDFVSGDAFAALDRIVDQLPSDLGVFGIGARFAKRLELEIPGLRELAPKSAKASLAASPHDVFLWLSAASAGDAFDRVDLLMGAARYDFRVAEQCPMFRYRDHRDLTGFVDGTENPVGPEAERAAIISSGPLAGGSFAFVQRFLHDREKFSKLHADERDNVIGRTAIDDIELDDAPAWAHVKRVDQKAYDPPKMILRKSMPWGDMTRAGLQFLAFTHDLDRIDALLDRMIGTDGTADALLSYTRAETGAYYFCPATKNGRPDLRALAR
jgi:putative iron-dependent peroxidase